MLEDYLAELTRRLREETELLGVYAGGSYGLGAYEPGRSDIDVTAIAPGPLAPAAKRAIAERVRHEALPCPARGLELVVYPLATARSGAGEPGFELNLNSGAAMPFRVDEQPGEIEAFWFAIDRSILRQSGVALHGPPPADLVAPVLNTCRGLRFAAEGAWSPKRAAGEWAAEEPVVRARSRARNSIARPSSDSSTVRSRALTDPRGRRSLNPYGQTTEEQDQPGDPARAREQARGAQRAQGPAASGPDAAEGRRPDPPADPPPGALSV
jgi:Nucleotidyltransferase domain